MDPLTHTLTGLYLKRTGLGRTAPRAALFMMLAANAPDIDVTTLVAGSATALHWHRHFTHSVFFAPVLALALTALFRLCKRKPFPWLQAWAGATVAILLHIALDLTNVYGVHAGWPVRTDWMHWDLTNIVDFWIWAILLSSLFAPFLGRLVGSEISSGKITTPQFGRGWAISALVLLAGYESSRFLLHSRALDVLNARLYEDVAPIRTAVYPLDSNLLKWRGVVETNRSYYIDDFNPTDLALVRDSAPIPKDGPGSWLPQLQQDPDFREFIAFNQAPLWRRRAPLKGGEPAQIRLIDLRFGTPADPAFLCEALFSPLNRVSSSQCWFGSAKR